MAEKDPQPDPLILQESRATKTGFLLSDTRLRAFVPTPEGKRMRPSDIWDHGEALSKRGHPGSTWFLCRTCFDGRPSAVNIYDITEATTAAVRHLRKSHKLLLRTGMKRCGTTPPQEPQAPSADGHEEGFRADGRLRRACRKA
jgi:hypothetical protein